MLIHGTASGGAQSRIDIKENVYEIQENVGEVFSYKVTISNRNCLEAGLQRDHEPYFWDIQNDTSFDQNVQAPRWCLLIY